MPKDRPGWSLQPETPPLGDIQCLGEMPSAVGVEEGGAFLVVPYRAGGGAFVRVLRLVGPKPARDPGICTFRDWWERIRNDRPPGGRI